MTECIWSVQSTTTYPHEISVEIIIDISCIYHLVWTACLAWRPKGSDWNFTLLCKVLYRCTSSVPKSSHSTETRQIKDRINKHQRFALLCFFFVLPFITLLSSRSTLSYVISTHCVQLSIFLFKEKNSQASWCRVLNTLPYWTQCCLRVRAVARSEKGSCHREAEAGFLPI